MDFGPPPKMNTEPPNENEALRKEKISPLRLPTQMCSSSDSSVSSEDAEWDGDLDQKYLLLFSQSKIQLANLRRLFHLWILAWEGETKW